MNKPLSILLEALSQPMPKIESGSTAFSQGDPTQSADVPQLPKLIRCPSNPQCESARSGQGCEHAMSRAELIDWLDRLRGHRINLETGTLKKATTADKVKRANSNERETL